VAGIDDQCLPRRIAPQTDPQASHDARAAAARKVSLTLADIVLIARQIGPGQEAPIEVTGSPPQPVKDQSRITE
jgi:hypothetical protein